MMLAMAESEAEVRALLEKDIYNTSGVWDLEKAQIIPVCFSYFWSPGSKIDSANPYDGYSSSLLFGHSFNGTPEQKPLPRADSCSDVFEPCSSIKKLGGRGSRLTSVRKLRSICLSVVAIGAAPFS